MIKNDKNDKEKLFKDYSLSNIIFKVNDIIHHHEHDMDQK
jgi:hypothetical protein